MDGSGLGWCVGDGKGFSAIFSAFFFFFFLQEKKSEL
jgi:hypothetical protein